MNNFIFIIIFVVAVAGGMIAKEVSDNQPPAPQAETQIIVDDGAPI